MDNKQKGQCTVIAITYPDTFLEQSGSHAMLTLASVRPQQKLAGKHATPLIQNLRADPARTVWWLSKPSDGVKYKKMMNFKRISIEKGGEKM